MNVRPMIGIGLLYLAVITTAVGLVYNKHLQRQYFIELQDLEGQQDHLRTEWERLQLEDSAWSNHARIEQIAADKLNMKAVATDDVIMLKLK